MKLSPKVKAVLMRVVKNAVNASLVALGPTATWPSHFNFTSREGLYHVGAVLGSAILARELMVWIPKLYAWSQTNGNGGTAT